MTPEQILQEIKRLKEEAYNDCQDGLQSLERIDDINIFALQNARIQAKYHSETEILTKLEKFIKGEQK